MKKIIIATRNEDLTVLDYGDHFEAGKGKYRVITKCKAGFMVSSLVTADSPIMAFRQFKSKGIQSIAVVKKTNNVEHDFTVYARAGKKVWACEEFLADLEVGDINQDLSNTALYNQAQYRAVNAATWASKAFVMNEPQFKTVRVA